MTGLLEKDALAQALEALPHWRLDDAGKTITRALQFGDFSAAFAFMTRVAMLAESMDHHPDWSNSYGAVTITLTSHDRGGITARDITLARQIDQIVPSRS